MGVLKRKMIECRQEIRIVDGFRELMDEWDRKLFDEYCAHTGQKTWDVARDLISEGMMWSAPHMKHTIRETYPVGADESL